VTGVQTCALPISPSRYACGSSRSVTSSCTCGRSTRSTPRSTTRSPSPWTPPTTRIEFPTPICRSRILSVAEGRRVVVVQRDEHSGGADRSAALVTTNGAAEQVGRFTLDNGLRLVTAPASTGQVASVNLWYDVGSRHEVPGRTGFAH